MIVNMIDYQVRDNNLIEVHFVSPDPSPYGQSDFYVMITTTEAAQNQTQLKATLTSRLQDKYGSAILDPVSGQWKGQGVAALNTFKSGGQNSITVNT